MDIGSSGYTEYEVDTDVTDFMMEKIMENEDWLNIKVGHIHSHNTMGVFFSGTDNAELNDNCPLHNFYLSLIVNNYMEMTAKVAVHSKPVKAPIVYTAQDELGEVYEISINTEKELPEAMFVYNCEILKPHHLIQVEDTFEERYKAIQAKPRKVTQPAHGTYDPASTKNQWSSGSGSTQTWPAGGIPNPNGVVKQLPAAAETLADRANKIGNNLAPPEIESFEERMARELTEENGGALVDDFDWVLESEKFTAYVLRMGEGDGIEGDTVESACEALVISQQPETAISHHIIDNFPQYYLNYYQEDIDTIVMEEYLDILNAVKENLEFVEEKSNGQFPFLATLIEDLKILGIATEDNWKALTFGAITQNK